MDYGDAPTPKPRPAPAPKPPSRGPKQDPGKKPPPPSKKPVYSPPGYRPPSSRPPSRTPTSHRPTPTPPPYKPYLPLPALKSTSSNAAMLNRIANITRRLPGQSRTTPYVVSRYLPAALRIISERLRRDRDEEERRKRMAQAQAQATVRYTGDPNIGNAGTIVPTPLQRMGQQQQQGYSPTSMAAMERVNNPWLAHRNAQQEAGLYPSDFVYQPVSPPVNIISSPPAGPPTIQPVGDPVRFDGNPYGPPRIGPVNPPVPYVGNPPGDVIGAPVGQPVPLSPQVEAFNYQYSPIATGAYPTNEQYPPNMTGWVTDEYGNRIVAPVHSFGPDYNPITDFANRYYPAIAEAKAAAQQQQQTGGKKGGKSGGGGSYYPRRYYGSSSGYSSYGSSYGGGGGGSGSEFAQYGITPDWMEAYKAFWGHKYPEKHWPLFQQAMELFARYLGRMPQMDDWQAMWQAMKDQPVAEGEDPRKNSFYDIAKWEPIVTGMMRPPQPVAPDVSYGPGLSF